jgi:polyferredoxin
VAPKKPFDLLRVPVLGAFFRWKHARTVLQSVLLGLAVLLILDGIFGPQLAPRNLAGVLPWVHWRGFVVVALLVAGNLFCMSCPFMLTRRIAKRILPGDRIWPRALRSKWLAVALLAIFFWSYEAFDLWASPWLTAWIAVTYFVAAFVVDGFFRGASFCKYVCPIGQFHFVNSLVSPLEVKVRDPAVCARCETKDCIRGRYAPEVSVAAAAHPAPVAVGAGPALPVEAPGGSFAGEGWETPAGRLLQRGCELWLFQERKSGNMDCTFCMECIHACPHENVGIIARRPGQELWEDPSRSGVGQFSRRPDLAALALLLTFGAFLNAFGMVQPVHGLLAWLTGILGIGPGPLLTAIVFVVGLLVLPILLVAGAAGLTRAATGSGEPLVRIVTKYAYALVPVGFGMWLAHYLFHFLLGALTVIPLVQSYLADLGFAILGAPRHGLGPIVPDTWIFPVQLFLLELGMLVSIGAAYRIARREEGSGRMAWRAMMPWAVLAAGLSVLGIWLLLQPMEMRGMSFGG